MLAVPLDGAREAAALGHAGHVHRTRLGQDRNVDRVAELQFGRFIQAELPHHTQGQGSGLAEMPLHGHGRVLRLLLAVAELYRAVAVAILGLDLGHDARPGLDDGHRNTTTVVREGAGHA